MKCPEPWLMTPRLRLREFVDDDRHTIVRMHQDTRMRALLIDDAPLHRHDIAALFLQRLQEVYRRREGLGIWGALQIVCPLDDATLHEAALSLSDEALSVLAQPQERFAGWFNLMPMPDDDAEVELGARLLPAAWGTGLALEGGELLLRHAFETLGLKRVWAVCHPRHDAVRYCVLSLGFRDAGLRPYDTQPAQHFLIERTAWAVHQARPRRERVRCALRQLRAERTSALETA